MRHSVRSCLQLLSVKLLRVHSTVSKDDKKPLEYFHASLNTLTIEFKQDSREDSQQTARYQEVSSSP